MVQIRRDAGSFAAGALTAVSLFDTVVGVVDESLLSARGAVVGAAVGARLGAFVGVVVAGRGAGGWVGPGLVVTILVEGLAVDVVPVAGAAVAGADADV